MKTFVTKKTALSLPCSWHITSKAGKCAQMFIGVTFYTEAPPGSG